jgi:hypothetical protein
MKRRRIEYEFQGIVLRMKAGQATAVELVALVEGNVP